MVGTQFLYQSLFSSTHTHILLRDASPEQTGIKENKKGKARQCFV